MREHLLRASALLLSVAWCGCGAEGCAAQKGPDDDEVPVAQTTTISPAGGSLAIVTTSGATVVLTFPPGAVDEPLDVTLTAAGPEAGEHVRLTLAPAGAVFNPPPDLAITLPDGVALGASAGAIYGSAALPFAVDADGVVHLALPTFFDTARSTTTALRTTQATQALTNTELSACETGGLVLQDAVDIALYVTCAEAAIARLEQEDDFDAALGASLTIAALLSGAQATGSDVAQQDVQSFVDSAHTQACAAYEAAVTSAEASPVSDYGDTVDALEGVYYWQGVVRGLEAGECPSLPPPADAVAATVAEAVQFYEAQQDELADSSAAAYGAAVGEVDALAGLLDEAQLLGVGDLAAPVEQQALPTLFDELLRAPTRECNEQQDYTGLIELMSQAASRPDQQLKIALAAQYCGTVITSEVVDAGGTVLATGTPLGFVVDAAPAVAGAILGDASGTLRLTGPIHALGCPVGQLDDADLVIAVDGVERERLTTAPFLGTALDIALADLAPDVAHDLTVTREGPSVGCGGFWGANPSPLLTLTVAPAQQVGGTYQGQHEGLNNPDDPSASTPPGPITVAVQPGAFLQADLYNTNQGVDFRLMVFRADQWTLTGNVITADGTISISQPGTGTLTAAVTGSQLTGTLEDNNGFLITSFSAQKQPGT